MNQIISHDIKHHAIETWHASLKSRRGSGTRSPPQMVSYNDTKTGSTKTMGLWYAVGIR